MKYKYYYNDEPLIEFCKKNPEYKYNQITKYISLKRQEDPSRTAKEIIEEFFSKNHRTNIRYKINGMNLSNYCKLMNISYFAVTKDICKSKKNPNYSDMSEIEIIDMVLNKHLFGNAEIFDIAIDDSNKLIIKPNRN